MFSSVVGAHLEDFSVMSMMAGSVPTVPPLEISATESFFQGLWGILLVLIHVHVLL